MVNHDPLSLFSFIFSFTIKAITIDHDQNLIDRRCLLRWSFKLENFAFISAELLQPNFGPEVRDAKGKIFQDFFGKKNFENFLQGEN